MSSMRPLVLTGPMDRHFTNEKGDAVTSCATADVAAMMDKASTNEQCCNEREIWRATVLLRWATSARTYGIAASRAIVHSLRVSAPDDVFVCPMEVPNEA